MTQLTSVCYIPVPATAVSVAVPAMPAIGGGFRRGIGGVQCCQH